MKLLVGYTFYFMFLLSHRQVFQFPTAPHGSSVCIHNCSTNCSLRFWRSCYFLFGFIWCFWSCISYVSRSFCLGIMSLCKNILVLINTVLISGYASPGIRSAIYCEEGFIQNFNLAASASPQGKSSSRRSYICQYPRFISLWTFRTSPIASGKSSVVPISLWCPCSTNNTTVQ